jgi:uncharacterized protein
MRAVRAAAALLIVAVCLVALPACGGEETDRVVSEIQNRAEQARERAREARERLAQRVREELEKLRKAVPEATPATQAPETAGRTETTRVEGFLTDVLQSVDSYWTKTLQAAGRPEPTVRYLWVPPNSAVRTGCGAPADDRAAFYCPSDDTIYVAVVLASRLWRGIADEFPGERAGYGHAVGDFGLAYVVAHEYAHNIQAELDLYRLSPNGTVEPFELQADCMAGLWANSVYREGHVQPDDVEEAMSTAAAAGDFDFQNAQHHGTPEERRAAWLRGFRSGEPNDCAAYVPA